VGLTVVAAGTSMPEVVTSIVSTIRGQRDIAIGNAVGSCVYNLLAVLGVATLVAGEGLRVAPALLAFDLPVT
jgi:cation:H+ antiporter